MDVYPVLFLEYYFPRKIRVFIYKKLKLFFLIFLLLVLFLGYKGDVQFFKIFLGLLFLTSSFLLLFFSLEAFFCSYYREKESEVLAGKIIYSIKNNDVVSAFFSSDIGKKIMYRLEIQDTPIISFLENRDNFPILSFNSLDLNMLEIGKTLIDEDKSFSSFLSSFGVDKKTFLSVIDWSVSDEEVFFRRELWWSSDYLDKIRGLGKDWSYGYVFHLAKYGKDLSLFQKDTLKDFSVKEYKEEVRRIESILSKGKDSNVLVVAEAGASVSDMIFEFVDKLKKGKISPSIEHKRVFSLMWNELISSTKTKTEFESEFIKILNEADHAGNIILLIDDMPGFINSARSLGSSVVGIIEPYLLSKLQVVAVSNSDSFHSILESNSALISRFEKLKLEETDEDKTIEILQNTVRKIEKNRGVLFSYFSILEIVRGTTQYIPGSVMPDSAIDMLFELLGSAYSADNEITRSDILDFIELKTKIPLGKLESSEKDKLLNLEDILHERVVGQDEAVSLISNAMRRARANIRNAKKPIGSFLFLGPTGVGKTETAKSLAHTFFGDEAKMMRLDMTEYQKADSIERLIGSFGDDKPGVLSKLIRNNSYGVLLLDEFEKAEKDVLNLFLQILDEGFYSDMNGKKVNMRNLIIIATSNASSDFIFELSRQGKNLLSHKDKIIDKIVNDGIFRPELINRFDATVVFHPLNSDELKKIAYLMLKKLSKRLSEKGIEFVVTDELAGIVADMGSDKIFGARPMNRFIQDKIEEPIARKIISGDIVSGSRVVLNKGDFV